MTALTKWKYTRQILALSLQRRSIGVPLCSKHAQQLCSTSTSNQGSFYDVVISGGGMVGAAMAAVLGKSPLPGSGFAALTLTRHRSSYA